jgi:alcohol dehydrogenase class IV
MKFEFATAGRILFGAAAARQLPALAKTLGQCALLVLGRSGRGKDALAASLSEAGVRSVSFHADGEPTTALVDEAKNLALDQGCDLVIALGGGSVIDLGKAVAGMLNNPGEAMDYLEVVGGGRPIVRPAVPWIAVPTTAGTGAEATRNAVLEVPERRVKVSLRSHHLLATIAVVDPELSLSLPRAVTAYTGMDALVQLIEPFVSPAANPITDGICREGLTLVARSLAAACRDGSDLSARTDMSAAALFSGIALANAKLGAVHGFAGVIGGIVPHPHGALCARLFPFVVEANLRALRERRAPDVLDRYTEVARRLTGNSSATPEDGLNWVRDLCSELEIPPLRASGLTRCHFAEIIPAAERSSSMQGNPVKLTADELTGILEAAL